MSLRTRIRRIRAMGNQPSQAKRKHLWMTNAGVIALILTVCFGASTYWRDQRADQEQRIRDIEVARCERTSESRDLIRALLLGIAVDLSANEETIATVSDRIDSTYPPVTPAECLRAAGIN